jgi:hypothetical protein
VTAGALGAFSVTGEHVAPAAGGELAREQSAELVSAQALRDISQELRELRQMLQQGLIGPSLGEGIVGEVRRQFALFLRANQKYPDFCEIGPNAFTDLYDWHVRHRQAIEITRADNRIAIRFMFTWMVLRPEQEANFVGIPFDRG